MASREQIVSTILEVAGNPSVGVIAELAEALADAIVALDAPKIEKRVTQPKETR
jgi:hypothetical protein